MELEFRRRRTQGVSDNRFSVQEGSGHAEAAILRFSLEVNGRLMAGVNVEARRGVILAYVLSTWHLV